MISKHIQTFKRASNERLEALRSLMKPDLGTHKKTRLTQAGRHGSGSILHDSVAKQHATLLTNDFRRIFGESEDQSNLRFVTILHSVVPVDTGSAVASVAEMEREIERVLAPTGARFLGAVEVEVISLELMRRIKASKGDQARKLTVLEGLIDPADGYLATGLLVHSNELSFGLTVPHPHFVRVSLRHFRFSYSIRSELEGSACQWIWLCYRGVAIFDVTATVL